MGTTDVVLFAKWTPVIVTHTVTYNGNGKTAGSVPVDTASPYTNGSTVTVKANTGNLERNGFTFAGWSTTADGNGTHYAATGTATFTMSISDVILYAKWTPILPTHTVTYNGNGKTAGSVPVDAASPYTNGSTVTVLGNTGNLTRTGYTFAGWNTQEN